MKKILIMGIIAIMIMTISIMTVSVMADEKEVTMFSNENKIVLDTNDFRVKFLRQNRVLIGNEEGNLMLGETLKRQEMVVLISRLMGVEAEAKSWDVSKISFKDVSKDNWSAPYIAWAKDNNITIGYDENTFGYNDSLTKLQTEIFLLRVLQFNEVTMENAELYSYLSAITEIEKDEKVNEAIIRSEVAKMIYNTIYSSVNNEENEQLLIEKLGMKEDMTFEEREIRKYLEKEEINLYKYEEVDENCRAIYVQDEEGKLNKEVIEDMELLENIVRYLNGKSCIIYDSYNKTKIVITTYLDYGKIYSVQINDDVIYTNNK